MERSWTYRVIAYSLITVLSVVVLIPTLADWTRRSDRLPPWFKSVFSRKIALGLDLQGGLHLVYEVQVDKAVSDKADRLAAELEEKLRKEKKVKDVKVARLGEGAEAHLRVTFPEKTDLRKIDNSFKRQFDRYITEESRDQEKGEVMFRMDADYVDELRSTAVSAGVETIKNRVDKLGVTEPVVQRKQNDIVVELAGLSQEDFERVKNLIGKTAQLEFKMADDGSEYMQKLAGYAETKEVKDAYQGLQVGYDYWSAKDTGAQHTDVYLQAKDRATLERFFKNLPPEYAVPADHQILFEETTRRNDQDEETQDKVWRSYYLNRRAELTGEYLTDADVQYDQNMKPYVSITFDSEGATLFEKASGANIGRKMAIILDEKVTSAPVIESRIGGGRAQITMGGYDPYVIQQEAKDLVAVLRTGALPAPLRKTFETQVGPTLGADQVGKARTSMIVGTLAVILFMIIYYRASGVIADIAMVFNVVYLLACLALLQATLTLPGIAAVVLTIGMAVDANIIIYERIREELRAGKTPRGAVEAGFGRAFWTVFDAHVTNLVAGIVLYSYGTGPIRGFAVSLMAGIVCNLFTSVWLSRAMFDWMVGRKRAATLSI
jgi:preprotein translocase subunit SecD